jgi:hypothetical protein
MPSYFNYLSIIFFFLTARSSLRLSLCQNMPSTILNSKHINPNFMQKHFIVVYDSRGKFTYQHNTYRCCSWICIHMDVAVTCLIVFLLSYWAHNPKSLEIKSYQIILFLVVTHLPGSSSSIPFSVIQSLMRSILSSKVFLPHKSFKDFTESYS